MLSMLKAVPVSTAAIHCALLATAAKRAWNTLQCMRIEQVAGEAGFQSALSLRQHFQATLGTSPRAYRAAFQVAATKMRWPSVDGDPLV